MAVETNATANQPAKQFSSLTRPAGCSLYVGDLHPSVTESDLFKVFRQLGRIVSVRLCRDKFSGKSLCYGYVNFLIHDEAYWAMVSLNYTNLKGKPMRIMWSQRDPLRRKTGIGNLFVKNLAPSISSARLQSLFCPFGTILSCKVAEDNGKSKGFGFVQFDSEESAMAAINSLHDTMVDGRKLYVCKFVRKTERMTSDKKPIFTNVYVKNIGEDMTEDCLREKFSEFGKVSSVAIMKTGRGESKGFGFVNFETPEAALKAVESFNSSSPGSKTLIVGRAQTKAEREILKYAQRNSSNLYVKNLDTSIDDRLLKEHFSPFGRITSARVMRKPDGLSKGYGFVRYTAPEEAQRAANALNGSVFRGKHIYVAMAQPKEERSRNYIPHSYYWNASDYYVPPFLNYSVFPLMQSPVSQPFFYNPLGANNNFPFTPENDSKNYFTHVQQGKTLTHDDKYPWWNCNIQSSKSFATSNIQDRSRPAVKRFGFSNKGSKSYNHAETSSVASTSSRELYPLVENIKPEHDPNATGSGWGSWK